MKLLIYKFILLAALSITSFEAFSIYILADSSRYDFISSIQGAGGGISRAIVASKQRIDAKNILMGDSVAGQLASHFNLDESWRVLTSLQGISLAGQYILVKNIIANKNIENIVFVYHPRSFMNDLNQPQTYLRFIRNFYNKENIGLLTKETIDRINEKPLSNVYHTSLSKVSSLFCLIDYRDDKYVDMLSERNITPYVSDTSLKYLKLIKEVCVRNNIAFRVIMPPISVHDGNRLNLIREQLSSPGYLRDVFNDYFANTSLLDDKYFSDAIHYSSLHDSAIKHIVNDKTLPLILLKHRGLMHKYNKDMSVNCNDN